MRVDFVTKEYPPNIYGGAGVHVTELVSVLRKRIEARSTPSAPDCGITDLRIRGSCAIQGANPALQTMATDLEIVKNLAGADLVHSHTWYANFAGHIGSMLNSIPHIITHTHSNR